MIPLLGSQLQFYQKKSYKLEMEVITLQDELLSLKTSKGDEYKIKYEMLLDKLAQESQLKQSKRTESLLLQEKSINQINQKWENLLNEKVNDYNTQLQALTLERNSIKNKVIELELKCIKLQKQIDDGDSQVLNIKLDALKKDNERLRKDNNDLCKSKEEIVNKMEKQIELKIESVKQRQKKFYREQIQTLQKQIQQLESILQSQRQKINPERQKVIHTLQNEIISIRQSQDLELQKLIELLQKKNKEIKNIREETQAKDNSNFQLINDLTNQVKNLEQKLFKYEFDKQMQIKAVYAQLSQIRQKEADDLKKQMQKIKDEFDLQREQWKKMILSFQQGGNAQRKDYQEEKQRFLQEKKRLKTKIAELKIRLKEKQQQQGDGQTQLLIKSLREMNNKEAHFNNYQDAITFMDRQVRKATIKIEQKSREVNNLLEELKTLQNETEAEITEVKEKSKNEQKKLYDKIFSLQEEVDDLQQKIRQKEKYVKKKQADLSEQKEGHRLEVQNLKKIIEQMERDYKRLTGNKKSIEDSYRQQRQNVISGKLDLNQEKKNKWSNLIKQRNELQIVYRERQMQLKGNYEMQIDKFKRQRQRLAQQKEQYRAQAQLLRQRLKQAGQSNKENRIVDYQQKLATLDLEIALTQNLFSTLSNATAKKGQKIRSQLQQLSEGRSSKIGESHSFEVKAYDIMNPMFASGQAPKEEAYKTGMFSFNPFNSNK